MSRDSIVRVFCRGFEKTGTVEVTYIKRECVSGKVNGTEGGKARKLLINLNANVEQNQRTEDEEETVDMGQLAGCGSCCEQEAEQSQLQPSLRVVPFKCLHLCT
jgi:hypothetical protein